MASLLFENKVKKWEKERLAVRERIANYDEQDGYFTELEQMAFVEPFKKKEMKERADQLSAFALGMAGINPELSHSLTSFLSLCETLYGNPDFKATARQLRLAADLMEQEEQRKKSGGNSGMKAILEKDAKEWHSQALAIVEIFSQNDYGDVSVKFLYTLFAVTGHESGDAGGYVRELQIFANQISGKNADLGATVQKFAALSQKYLKEPAKLNQFRAMLREKGMYGHWDVFCNSIRENARREREEQQRREEQARRTREEEERRRREEERRAREERQRREATERERKAREEKAREERARRNAAFSAFMKKVAAVFTVLILAYVGYRLFTNWRTNVAFDNQIALGDQKLAEGQYKEAVAEFRKALQIDNSRSAVVMEKEAQALAALRSEYDALLEELKVILKADRNVFTEDSEQRLDKMLELMPEDEECVKYRNMREKQKKRNRRY